MEKFQCICPIFIGRFKLFTVMENHNTLLLALLLLSAVVYVLMIVFNALGGVGYAGLFNQSVGQVSDKYQVYITPAGFTFIIWSFIYIFLGAGAIYCVSSVFRKSGPTNPPVYLHPMVLNWVFYLMLTTNYALNTAWIFIWDRELIVASSIFLLFIAYSGWVAFTIAVIRGKRTLDKNGDRISQKIALKEVRLQRIFIHNAIAFYTTWTTIASLLNLNIAFQYIGGCNAETTSIVCSAILLAIITVWFFCENFWADAYVRYTVSQYPVVIFAVSGILAKQADPKRLDGPVPSSVNILTWIILGVAILQFVMRIAIVTYRFFKRPLDQIYSPAEGGLHRETAKEC